MAQELKRIDILSVAKVYAVLAAIFGFIEGLFIAAFPRVATQTVSVMGIKMTGVSTLGPLAIIAVPVLSVIIGFIAGAIGAFLYNVVAGWVGGVELEFEKK